VAAAARRRQSSPPAHARKLLLAMASSWTKQQQQQQEEARATRQGEATAREAAAALQGEASSSGRINKHIWTTPLLAWRSIELETSCLLEEEEEEATTSMHSFVEMEIINGKAIFFWPLILPSPCIRTAISSSWKSTVASGHCCFQCPDFVFVFFKPKKKTNVACNLILCF
jgi:hypothetical protein